MEKQIKAIAEKITHNQTKKLVIAHVKALEFENNHLVIYVDNTGPLHELGEKENDQHLRKALDQVYGEDITYELKHFKHFTGDYREKAVPHNIR
jgi:hypothetical protein